MKITFDLNEKKFVLIVLGLWVLSFIAVFICMYFRNKGMVLMGRPSGLRGYWPWADWSSIALIATFFWSMAEGLLLAAWVAIRKIKIIWTTILLYIGISIVFVVSGVRIGRIHPREHGVILMIALAFAILVAITYLIRVVLFLFRQHRKKGKGRKPNRF